LDDTKDSMVDVGGLEMLCQ